MNASSFKKVGKIYRHLAPRGRRHETVGLDAWSWRSGGRIFGLLGLNGSGQDHGHQAPDGLQPAHDRRVEVLGRAVPTIEVLAHRLRAGGGVSQPLA